MPPKTLRIKKEGEGIPLKDSRLGAMISPYRLKEKPMESEGGETQLSRVTLTE